MLHEMPQAAEVINPWIEVDGHMFQIGELHPSLPQAELHALYRQARPVFDSIETLLLDRRDELSVPDDGRRRIAVPGVDAENDTHPVTVSAEIPHPIRADCRHQSDDPKPPHKLMLMTLRRCKACKNLALTLRK